MQRYLFSTTSSLNLSLFCSHTPRQQERAKNSTSIRRAAVPMFFATSGCNPTWHWPPHLLVPTQLQSRKARTQHPFIAKQFQCILHSHSEEPHQIVNCAPHTQCRLFHASRFWWKPSPCYSHVRFFPTAFPWRPLEPQNLQTQPRLPHFLSPADSCVHRLFPTLTDSYHSLMFPRHSLIGKLPS